jgi:deoxycytidylate deaminase
MAGCAGAAASPPVPAPIGSAATSSPAPTATVLPTPTASPTGKSGTFTATGAIAPPPADPTSVYANDDASLALLKDGEVLYIGYGGAQIYDPATGKFRTTATQLASAGHAFDPNWSDGAVTLPDGRVFVLGGGDTQIYDPSAGSFARTGDPRSSEADAGAVLLHDGRVLSIGENPDDAAAGALCDVWDPATGRFSPTGSMKTARALFTATVLLDGRVLVTGGLNETQSGGSDFASAEIYDPATGKWTRTGSMASHRYRATATLLASGKVLIAGGDSEDPEDIEVDNAIAPLTSAELYDPATGKFAKTGSMLVGRDWATASLLGDGRVLVAGGGDEESITATAEIYDPSPGTFTLTGPMTRARILNPSLLLPDGRVLVVGRGSADLYWP